MTPASWCAHGLVLALAGAAALGCNFDPGGMGSTAANLGDGPGTDAATMSGDGTSGGSDSGGSGGGSGTGIDGTASATDGTDCPGGCPANWVCQDSQCVDPGGGCGAGCGAMAPFCAPDGMCHAGGLGEPCFNDTQCVAPLLCGPGGTCQAGGEGDPCLDGSNCSASAPLCASDGQCHDGSPGDPCGGNEHCLAPLVCGAGNVCLDDTVPPCATDGDCAGLLCGPGGVCQTGGEGDPCDGPEDCGGGAPHCPYDHQCHNGSFGDPCSNSSQCMGNCYVGFCGL